jgi:hypothetical protein
MAQPVGDYEEVKGFVTIKLSATIDRLDLPYVIPNRPIVRPDGKDSGYFPDVLLLNCANLVTQRTIMEKTIHS